MVDDTLNVEDIVLVSQSRWQEQARSSVLDLYGAIYLTLVDFKIRRVNRTCHQELLCLAVKARELEQTYRQGRILECSLEHELNELKKQYCDLKSQVSSSSDKDDASIYQSASEVLDVIRIEFSNDRFEDLMEVLLHRYTQAQQQCKSTLLHKKDWTDVSEDEMNMIKKVTFHLDQIGIAFELKEKIDFLGADDGDLHLINNLINFN